MAEAFKIGEGYVQITSRVDRDQIARDAEAAGEDAGESFGEKFDRAASKDADKSGEKTGKEFGKGTARESGKAGKSSGDSWAKEFDAALNGPRKKKKKGDGPKHNDDGKSVLDRFGSMLKKTLSVAFSPSTTMAFVKGLGAVLMSPPVIATVVAAGASLGTLLASGLSASLLVALPTALSGGLLALGVFMLRTNKTFKKHSKKLHDDFVSAFETGTSNLLGPLIKAMKILDSLVNAMRPAISVMFQTVGQALVPLAEGLKGFFINLSPGLLALTGLGTDGLINFGAYLPKLGTILSDFFLRIQRNWPAIKKAFGEFFSDVSMVMGWITNALFWLATNYEKVKTILGWSVIMAKPVIEAAKAIYKVFKWLYDVLVGHSIVPDLVNGIIRWFAKLPAKIVGYVANMVPRVISWFGRMASQAVAAAGRLVGQVASTLSRLPGRAAAAVRGLWGSMTGFFSTAISNARARAWSLVNGVVNVLSQLPGRARTQAGRVKSAITGAFSNSGSWLVAAGRRIIQGLINGVTGMIGSLRSRFNSITNMIPDWKGPADRDAVLLRPAGESVMDGFMAGVESRISDLKSQLQGITNGMPAMAVSGAPSGAALASTGGLTIANLTVNLKGVLDLSDPVGYRATVVQLQAALSDVERSRSRSR